LNGMSDGANIRETIQHKLFQVAMIFTVMTFIFKWQSETFGPVLVIHLFIQLANKLIN